MQDIKNYMDELRLSYQNEVNNSEHTWYIISGSNTNRASSFAVMEEAGEKCFKLKKGSIIRSLK